MRFVHFLSRVAILSGLGSALCGCSYTLAQTYAFTASGSMSLAVVEYPTPDDGSLIMNTVLFQSVDLGQQQTGNRVVSMEPPSIGTRQLKPNLALDDGSLYPGERAAQQTRFVPIELPPGDYMIKGGLGAVIGLGGATFVGSLQEKTMFCRAPIFRVAPNSVSIVDARGMLALSGNAKFSADPDTDRTFKRGKIAIGGYPQIHGEVVWAQYLGTAVFPYAEEACSQNGRFKFESMG